MMSRSYTNLLDLATGNFPAIGRERKRLPRVMTVPGNVYELDDDQANSVSSDNPSSVAQDRLIIVANQLPVKANRRADDRGWVFSWNEDSLLLQLKEEEVSQILLETFKCVPTFLPHDVLEKFYHGFCKKLLWPLFHYMLPFSADHGGRFDRSMWEAYVWANKLFSQKVIEAINPDDDYVWIHDYHLMVLPTFLRRHFNQLRMGFFLHSPFPSSEIYRTLPVREEILKALLNSDLIGFHTFDYARHFLSCCSRMLGLEYQSKRGYIGLEYYGRTVGIKIMPVGIHMGRIASVMKLADKEKKLLAMEQLLQQHSKWQGKTVLVQIANPARGKGADLEEIQAEIRESCRRINEEFGEPGYEPIVFVDRPVSISERIAYYSIAELLSEFIGCSPSLSGAICVNPWNVEATAEAMNEAISMSQSEQLLRHEKHFRYVSTHDVAYWSRSFLQDMERTCSELFRRRCWGIGLKAIVSAYCRAKSRAILLDYDGTVMPQNSINKAPSQEVISILNTLCWDKKNIVFIVSGRGRDNLSQWFSPCRKLGLAAEAILMEGINEENERENIDNLAERCVRTPRPDAFCR
ncbi:unnamed protein product, partial [Vitis vinifera]